MFITITNASKGKPHRLLEQVDGCQIGIKSISGRVGWYNIKEELEWRYTYNPPTPEPGGTKVTVFPSSNTIEPGLYNFDTLVETLTSEIDGFEINANKNAGKISMTVPRLCEISLPDPIKKILGIDDEGVLTEGEYIGDHSVEFSPQRIEIYLRQLNTSKNLASRSNETLSGSQLLGLVPLSTAGFGEYFSMTYENPCMKALQHRDIHELDLDFKVVWRSHTEKLDNHNQPLDLELILV